MENIGFGSYDFVFGCNNWAKADMDAALKVNMNAAIPSLNALKIKKSFQSLLSGHDDKFTNLSVQELSDKLMENGVTAPETKNSHSDPHSFNLMFQTSIGSSGLALAFPFDGVLGVSAYALSSHSAEMWSTDFDREESMVAVDLKSVGTHKISHVCGLGYYSLKEAVMYPNSTFGSLFQSNSSAQNLLLGLLWMQSTYVGHDSGHHKVMLSHGYNAFTQIIYGNCLPKISIAWKWIHNADHNVCNILDYDPDLQHIPLFDVPHLRNWSKRIMFVLACFVVCSIQHLQCCLNHFASSVCVPGHHMPMTALRSRQGGTLDISCSS